MVIRIICSSSCSIRLFKASTSACSWLVVWCNLLFSPRFRTKHATSSRNRLLNVSIESKDLLYRSSASKSNFPPPPPLTVCWYRDLVYSSFYSSPSITCFISLSLLLVSLHFSSTSTRSYYYGLQLASIVCRSKSILSRQSLYRNLLSSASMLSTSSQYFFMSSSRLMSYSNRWTSLLITCS